MKQVLSPNHFIFTPEQPKGPVVGNISPSIEDVTKFLNTSGENAEIVSGHYGSPERSILVHNPKNVNGLHQMAADLGQESAIHSQNGKHSMHFYHGPNAGQIVKGIGTKFHKEKPEDNYTAIHSVEGPVHFQHNFDFSTLGKSELKKGVKKLYPFNPANVPEGERRAVEEWQDMESASARENIPEMDPNAKGRALHKLHAKTQVRKNPNTNQREFLLHRAMSGQEFLNNSTNGNMNHEYGMSSWTPHFEAANAHAEANNNKHVVSAWVPESHIHYVVPQIGEQHTKRPFTSSSYAWEHEVIVKPHHNSQIHQDEVRKSERDILKEAKLKLSSKADDDDVIDLPDHIVMHASSPRWK